MAHLFCLQYRYISASFIAESVAGNLVIVVRVSLFCHVDKWIHDRCRIFLATANVPVDTAGNAAAIRDALMQFREPHRICILESMKSEQMLETSNAGQMPTVFVRSNELLIQT